MIPNLKPYHDYKDSGVPWLGQVPAHWEVLPGRTVFREINDRGHTDEQMLSVTITRGVLRQADLLADSSKKDSSNEDKSNYKLVQQGDVVYNKMRAWQGAVGVSDYRGIVSPAYIVQRLRSAENLPRYMHFLFRTPLFASEAERWSYGITSDQWSLRAEEFKCIYFSVPSLPEQAAIVRFLDYMERRMRRAMRARQKRITLLEEYKQALINEAVTGKIDVRTGKPYPAYKNSGVKWLGRVPEHWEVRRIKRICWVQGGYAFPSSLFSEIGVPVVRMNNLKRGFLNMDDVVKIPKSECIQDFNLKAGDILYGLSGSIGPTGSLGNYAILTERDLPAMLNQRVARIVPIRGKIEAAYLVQIVQTSIFYEQVLVNTTGTAQFNVSTNDIMNVMVAVAPLSEQTAIVEYLDAQTAKLDAAIAATRRAIELLREYRERLIADVATGKVDVREVAAQLPEEPPENEGMDVTEEEAAIAEVEDEILNKESDAEV